jgi:hypothetical protein
MGLTGKANRIIKRASEAQNTRTRAMAKNYQVLGIDDANDSRVTLYENTDLSEARRFYRANAGTNGWPCLRLGWRDTDGEWIGEAEFYESDDDDA